MQKLYELGYIDEYITEENLRNESQTTFSTTAINANELTLSEGTYIVGLDTATNEVVDIDDFINKASKISTLSNIEGSSDVSIYNSLLVYTVKFETFISDPNTNNARYHHSVVVNGVYGVGTRPNNYTIIANIKRATSRNGTYYSVANQTKTVALKEKVTITAAINTSYFWVSDSIAYANYPNISYAAEAKNEGPWLLNKKGVKYPEYTDPKSGKVMIEPASTAWTASSNSSCALTTTDRTAYRTWYDNNYGALNWTNNYEIHHIRPCKWGGNKDYSNLIPLPYSFHRSVVSPWWTAY